MLLLQATLTGVLLAKRMWRIFPLFVTYAACDFFMNIGAYTIYALRFRRLYFYVFWIDEAIGLFLGLAVVYEIFKHVFAPYPALRRLARHCFQAAVVFLVLLGSFVAYGQPISERDHIHAVFLVTEEATRIMEVGLLVFLFVFAGAFGLRWREYAFGIALGLGLCVTPELVAVAMRVQFGMATVPIVNLIRSISFACSLFIWIAYLVMPDVAPDPTEMPRRAQLEQWNRAVMELIYQ